eukprot:Sdes_comp10676_c0_seq2m2369
MSSNWARLFGKKRCNIFGMIHVQALPGTPRSELAMSKIISMAMKEAEIYCQNSVASISCKFQLFFRQYQLTHSHFRLRCFSRISLQLSGFNHCRKYARSAL